MGTACTVSVTVRPGQSRAAAGRSPPAGRRSPPASAPSRASTRAATCPRLNARSGELGGSRTRGWPPRFARPCAPGKRPTDGSTRRSFPPSSPPATTAHSTTCSVRPARAAAGWRAGAGSRLAPDKSRARIESGAARRPRRHRQGILGRTRTRRDASPPRRSSTARSSTSAATSPPGAPSGPRTSGGSQSPTRAAPETTLGMLRLLEGGVATSGRDARRFGPDRSAPSSDRPGDRCAGRARAARGHRRRRRIPPEAEAHATALAISSLAEARAHLAGTSHFAALYVPRRASPSRSAALRSSRRPIPEPA